MSNSRLGLRTRPGLVRPDTEVFQFKNFLLNDYPAYAAYSLRLLNSAYTGSAIKVRRSGDNTEQNIGFDAYGNLDEVRLKEFIGSNNGFVTTWYDQSGNSRDLVQSTAANQPQIVVSGIVLNNQNKVTVRFDGTNDSLTLSSLGLTSEYVSVFSVQKNDDNGSGDLDEIFGIGNQSNGQARFNAIVFGNYLSAGFASNLTISAASCFQYIHSSHFDNANDTIYGQINNGTEQNASRTLANMSSPAITIGSLSGAFYKGFFNEGIIYSSDQRSNTSGIISNLNDYYKVY